MKDTKPNLKLLHNVTIFTNNNLQYGYLLIENNTISEIGKGNPPKSLLNSVSSIIDCENAILLPGFIDSHVHLRDMDQSYKETLETGTKAAITSGVTTVLAMPNTSPPLSTIKTIQRYVSMKNQLYCNVGLFTTVKQGFDLEKLDSISSEGIFGIKIYPGDESDKLPLRWVDGWKNDLYPDNFNKTLKEILSNFQYNYPNWTKLFKSAKRLNLPLLFHPELPRLPQVLQFFFEKGQKIATLENSPNPNLFAHNVSHPIYQNELAHIEMIISLIRKFNPDPKICPHIHFVHVSNSDAIDVISTNLKQEDYPCSIEVSPHHMLLNYDMHFDQETFAKVLVPLRSQGTQSSLFKRVQENQIDTIGTDHAPHSIEEKQKEFVEAPSGFPSLDFASRILLTQVFNKKLSLEQFVNYYSLHPARIFQIPNKGSIQKGYDADLVLVKEIKPYLIKGENAQGMQKWTPWENFEISAEILKVFLGGKFVFDSNGGHLIANGNFIKKKIHNLYRL